MGAWIEVDRTAPVTKRHEACFVFVTSPILGRRAYLVGGRGFKDVDIYDPYDRIWIRGAEPPVQMHHVQCVAAQGKLWVGASFVCFYICL